MIIDNPSPQHIPTLRSIWKEAFGDSDEFLDAFFEAGFAYDRCRCVFLDHEPVAAIYLFPCSWQEKKVAYLYALAVEANHQKQGLSRLLLTDTHAKLRQDGFAGAIMEPATKSLQAYYERLGYRSFGGRHTRQWIAGEQAAICCKLGKLGYEQARKKHLPENSVLQEGAFTELFDTQAEFYGGEGFVAAVSRQEPIVLEYLGDESKIPGLLAGLKMESAYVRLPGGDPTTVYMDFAGNPETPSYFGLPMD